ncbi:T9SS type A sorting domain-containing protein [Flavobacterium sp.]|uniref:T9SS type A sorting domain-containing protein n=1 Tax=Flavobacterium sp. TaxID=239 RepID=UPI0039E366BE
MRKKIILLTLTLSVSFSAFSQKELWWLYTGYNSDIPGFPANHGSIRKVDFDGQNETIVHTFDSINGKLPYELEKLFLASNGKLYGTASRGGFSIPNSSLHDGAGVLFEYDLILNTFNVLTFFGTEPLPTATVPKAGVIENAGVLYGTTSGYGSIYKYNLVTEATSFGAQIPNFNNHQNEITGELMKATNGMIYGTTRRLSSCPDSSPFLGAIARFNPANNSFTILHPFYCVPTEEGWAPTGGLVEGVAGKLYGTTALGGIHYGATANAPYGSGILFEYNIATNMYTKKIDFDIDTNGYLPGPLTLGANGKLYGLLSGYYNAQTPEGSIMGSLYEYDIPTGTMTVLHDFTWDEAGGAMQGTLLKGSDGNLYGSHKRGIFRFNPTTNQSVNILESPQVQNLIEVCRKPSYHFFETDTFEPCVDTPFSFDVQNTNATSYVWKKNDQIVPSQTTAILNFPSITAADSGDYVCEMTNECGTTVTMALHIEVGCLGIEEMAAYQNKITLYPNPAKDVLHVKLPPNHSIKVVRCAIFNMLGQRVYDDSSYASINTSSFNSGIYQVVLKTDKGNWVGKFVKE